MIVSSYVLRDLYLRISTDRGARVANSQQYQRIREISLDVPTLTLFYAGRYHLRFRSGQETSLSALCLSPYLTS